jgi:cardiolipin synthase
VTRTADDLLRYHYKFMIVDRQILYILAFNYTHPNIGKTHSFGLITKNPTLVREATRLFEADVRRQTYTPELGTFLVSPINARQELSRFLEGANEQLFIYDPEISDRRMIRLLRGRAKAGVEIRLIGRVKKSSSKLEPNGLNRARFHTRTIIRDRNAAFIGSQSLRETELDRRRELGVIVQDHHVVHTLLNVFESDWAALKPKEETASTGGAVKRLSDAVVRDLPLEPLVEKALHRVLNDIRHAEFAGHKLEHKLEDVMREALEDTVSQIVRKTVEAEARA